MQTLMTFLAKTTDLGGEGGWWRSSEVIGTEEEDDDTPGTLVGKEDDEAEHEIEETEAMLKDTEAKVEAH